MSLLGAVLLSLACFVPSTVNAQFSCGISSTYVQDFKPANFTGTWYLGATEPDFFRLFTNKVVNLQLKGNSFYGSESLDLVGGLLPVKLDITADLEANGTFNEKPALLPFLSATKKLQATDYNQYAIIRGCLFSIAYTELLFRQRCPNETTLAAANKALQELNLDPKKLTRDPTATGKNCA